MTGSVGDVQFKTFTFKNNFTTCFCGTVMDGGGGGGGVQLSQGYRATTKRQFTFYHLALRTSWYSFSHPEKDERLS